MKGVKENRETNAVNRAMCWDKKYIYKNWMGLEINFFL